MVQPESYGNTMETKITFQAGFKCTKRTYSDVITAAQSPASFNYVWWLIEDFFAVEQA